MRSVTPIVDGIMYDDGRAPDEARRAQDAGAALWDRLGVRIQPSWALTKVPWLTHTRQPIGLAGARARIAHASHSTP